MQCMHPNDACTSVSGETIIKMMINSKTSTKPLVVIADDGEDNNSDPNVKIPGKTYLDRGSIRCHNVNSV